MRIRTLSGLSWLSVATFVATAAGTASAQTGPHAVVVPVSVLSEIAPEYIEEITYHDCFDTSMAAVGSQDAIFVVLKPGVVYQENEGAFVLDTPAAQPSRP